MYISIRVIGKAKIPCITDRTIHPYFVVVRRDDNVRKKRMIVEILKLVTHKLSTIKAIDKIIPIILNIFSVYTVLWLAACQSLVVPIIILRMHRTPF